MNRRQQQPGQRRGAVAPLTAFLLIPILMMVAYSVDIGYMAMTSLELQNAVDAAALAAAEQRQPYYVRYYSSGADQATVLSTAETQATLFAKNFAYSHRAGNTQNIVLDTTNDVVFGYQDANTPFTSTLPSATFPNTVEVTLRLNGGQATNPQLNLFFGPVIGVSKATVTAKARATIYTGTVSDFSGPDAGLLPVTLDVQVWNSFAATGIGSLTDFSYTGTTSTSASTTPAPGVANTPQILVSPDPNGRPGGWNFLSLDSQSNGNDNYKTWFANGLRQTDIDSLHTGGQLPLPAQPADPTNATYFWKGSPGDRGNSEPYPPVGSVRLLPLYVHVPASQASTYTASDKSSGTWDGNGGRGQNSWFNIIEFVGVVITDTSNGLSVQPAAYTDTNAVLTNVQAAGKPAAGAQVTTTFTAPKLSY